MGGILGEYLLKSKGVTKMVGTIAGGMSTAVATLSGVRLHLCGVLSVAYTMWVATPPPPVAVGIDAIGVAFRGVASPQISTLCEARGGFFTPTTTPCWCKFGRSLPESVFGWNGGGAASCGMVDAAQEA